MQSVLSVDGFLQNDEGRGVVKSANNLDCLECIDYQVILFCARCFYAL
jgi:hypothetical protein